MDIFVTLFQVVGESFAKIFPITIAMGIGFAVLTHFFACNPGKPWWQKKEIATDVVYWFAIPLDYFPVGVRFSIECARPQPEADGTTYYTHSNTRLGAVVGTEE